MLSVIQSQALERDGRIFLSISRFSDFVSYLHTDEHMPVVDIVLVDFLDKHSTIAWMVNECHATMMCD